MNVRHLNRGLRQPCFSNPWATWQACLAACWLVCLAAPCARGQFDPTTQRPNLPPIKCVTSPVLLQAIYDDQDLTFLRKRFGAAPLEFTESVVRQSYNRMSPGPAICVNMNGVDDYELEIRLQNLLTAAIPIITGQFDSDVMKKYLDGEKNITNLHTHGLHVSPSGMSDNVLLKVNPQRTADYLFRLPSYHAPGTHWYHSHHHGSTATQVNQGMLGALLVLAPRGQQLTPPEYVLTTKEELVVLTTGSSGDTPLTPEILPALMKSLTPDIAAIMQKQAAAQRKSASPELQRFIDVETEGQLDKLLASLRSENRVEELLQALADVQQPATTFANGVLNPVVERSPGDIVRMRLINAGASNRAFKELYIRGHDMYLAAADGVNLTHLPKSQGEYVKYNFDNKLSLAPGNRADVYVMLNGTGTFALMGNGLENRAQAQAVMSFEVSNPSLSAVADTRYSNEGLAEFLNALNRHLVNLQRTVPAYQRGGYLAPFTAGELAMPVTRTIEFSIENRNTSQPDVNFRRFFINRRAYNEQVGRVMTMPGATDYLGKHVGDGGLPPAGSGAQSWPIRKGTVEKWVLKNGGENPGRQGHPFHIHVNPFWVAGITKDGVPVTNDQRLNRWQDTIRVGIGEEITIVHRFDDFEGLYVQHCHILNHEDRGMMMNVLIVPNELKTQAEVDEFFKKQLDENKRLNEQINNSR